MDDDSKYVANVRYLRLDDWWLSRVVVDGSIAMQKDHQKRTGCNEQGQDAQRQGGGCNRGELHLRSPGIVLRVLNKMDVGARQNACSESVQVLVNIHGTESVSWQICNVFSRCSSWQGEV